MKYDVEAVVKKVVNLTIDADNEDIAAEIADKKLNVAYDCDTYYDIVTITKLED